MMNILSLFVHGEWKLVRNKTEIESRLHCTDIKADHSILINILGNLGRTWTRSCDSSSTLPAGVIFK